MLIVVFKYQTMFKDYKHKSCWCDCLWRARTNRSKWICSRRKQCIQFAIIITKLNNAVYSVAASAIEIEGFYVMCGRCCCCSCWLSMARANRLNCCFTAASLAHAEAIRVRLVYLRIVCFIGHICLYVGVWIYILCTRRYSVIARDGTHECRAQTQSLPVGFSFNELISYARNA